MNVELALGIGPATRIALDGQDVSGGVFGLDLHADVESVPTLTLHIPLVDALSTSGEARVQLTEETHAALVALGWTPPEASND